MPEYGNPPAYKACRNIECGLAFLCKTLEPALCDTAETQSCAERNHSCVSVTSASSLLEHSHHRTNRTHGGHMVEVHTGG